MQHYWGWSNEEINFQYDSGTHPPLVRLSSKIKVLCVTHAWSSSFPILHHQTNSQWKACSVDPSHSPHCFCLADLSSTIIKTASKAQFKLLSVLSAKIYLTFSKYRSSSSVSSRTGKSKQATHEPLIWDMFMLLCVNAQMMEEVVAEIVHLLPPRIRSIFSFDHSGVIIHIFFS